MARSDDDVSVVLTRHPEQSGLPVVSSGCQIAVAGIRDTVRTRILLRTVYARFFRKVQLRPPRQQHLLSRAGHTLRRCCVRTACMSQATYKMTGDTQFRFLAIFAGLVELSTHALVAIVNRLRQ